MDTKNNINEKSRKQMGSLVIYKQNYPVYEGLNVIGRDLKATIRVSDLTFSKRHAILTIVNNTHFVSDFHSSNGTKLKNINLIPYKCYEIKDSECIMFGDIVGTYNINLNLKNEENVPDSLPIDHNAATQIISENVKTESNQAENIHTEINIHDSDTQACSSQMDVHDLPTQLFQKIENETTQSSDKTEDYNVQEVAEENHLNISHNETYDDVFQNESFKLSVSFPSETNLNIEVDETLITDNKSSQTTSSHKKSKSSSVNIFINDDDDIIPSTQNDVSMEEKSGIEKDKEKEKSDKDVGKSDDSETDIEDEGEFKKSDLQKSIQSNDSAPNINTNKSKTTQLSKNQDNDDDSDTDIEDIELIRKNVHKVDSEINKSIEKPNQGTDDSETDAENFLTTEKLNCEKSISKISEDSVDKNLSISSETEEEDDLIMKNPQVLSENKIQVEKGSEDELDLLAGSEFYSATELQDNSETDNLFDDLAPTQLLENNKNNEQQITNLIKNKETIIMNSETNNAPQDQPENKIKANKSSNDKLDLLAGSNFYSTTDIQQNIPENQNLDFDAPTQLLQSNAGDGDDDFLAPTQLIQTKQHKMNEKGDVGKDNDLLAPTQLLEDNRQSNVEYNDDDDLPPTQLLQSKIADSNKQSDLFPVPAAQLLGKKKLEITTKNISIPSNNDDDDDDLPPTQLLQADEKNESIKNDTRQTDIDNDSIFLTPTQPLQKSAQRIFSPPLKSPLMSKDKSSKSRESIKTDDVQTDPDDIYMASTQPLQKNTENINIYEEETQPLQGNNQEKLNLTTSDNDSMIDIVNTTQESENVSLKLNETDESINFQNESLNTSTSKQIKTKKPPEPESQLEVNFDLETQKLYTEEKTSRPDNPLAHMFVEEPTQIVEEENVENQNNETEYLEKKEQDIEHYRRLQVKLENINYVKESNIQNKIEKEKEKEQSIRRTRSSINVNDKSSTSILNLKRVKNSVDFKGQLKYEIKKELGSSNKQVVSSTKKESDDETDKPLNTRNRRLNRNLKEDIKTPEKTPRRKNIVKDNIEETSENDHTPITRSKRANNENLKEKLQNKPSGSEVKRSRLVKKNTPQEKPKASRIKESVKEDLSDMEDFQDSKISPLKRTHSATKINKKAKKDKLIEDSDDTDSDIGVKKQVRRIQYTQDSDDLISNSTTPCSSTPSTRRMSKKRAVQFEEYSTDEDTSGTSVQITPKKRKYEPLDVTTSQSSLQSSSVSRESVEHKVVFTLLNDSTLENKVEKLGGVIVDSVHSSTVLVTNKISRSLKFLTAVALGIPVVQPKWITDSAEYNSFQDPWNYLLKDTETELKLNLSLKLTLKRSSKKKLFSGFVFVIATTKNCDVLKEIIQTSGGKCLMRAPAKGGKAIVVSYDEDKPKYTKYLKKNLTVVSAEAIFSNVLRQEINWKEYLLS